MLADSINRIKKVVNGDSSIPISLPNESASQQRIELIDYDR